MIMSRVSNLFLLLTASIISLCAVSCTESDASSSSGGSLTLTSTTNGFAAIGSPVSFTVTFKGQDVTEESTTALYCIDDTNGLFSIDGMSYTLTSTETHNFYAEYIDSDGISYTCGPEVIVGVDTSCLYLYASRTEVIEGMTDEKVTFSVYVASTEISSDDPDLCFYVEVNGEVTQLDALEYTISDEGEYNFYATYPIVETEGPSNSNTATVNSLSYDEIAFNKRTVGFVFTGTWCGYCPYMTAAIYLYNQNYDSDKLIVAAAHYDDIMSNSYSSYLTSSMNISGFPTFLLGSVNSSHTSGISSYSADAIAEAIALIDERGVSTAIAAGSTGNSDKFAITATIAVNKDGQYGVGAMIVEDNITASQSNYSTAANLGVSGYDFSNHINVLQGFYPMTTALYEELGGVSQHTAGSVYDFSCEIETSDMTTLFVPSNCRIMVYTYDIATGYVDNVIQTAVNGSRNFDAN